MRKEIQITDGCALIPCPGDMSELVVTKWYGQSLAIFKETEFLRYLQKLDTDFKENGHGRSVIRFFLSSAATMLEGDGEYRLIPEVLVDTVAANKEDKLILVSCPCSEKYPGCFPIGLLAAAENIDGALEMTHRRHS